MIFRFLHLSTIPKSVLFGLNLFHIWHVVFLFWWVGDDLQQVMLCPLQNICNPHLY